jgi:polyphosphate glucokinase
MSEAPPETGTGTGTDADPDTDAEPGTDTLTPTPTETPVPAVDTATKVILVKDTTEAPRRPFTLAVDVGGTGIKASVLDADGKMVADRVRVDTTYPFSPEAFVECVVSLAKPLPAYDRVSVGFPGVVRAGLIITAPHFVTKAGPGTKVVKELLKAWTNFPAADRLEAGLGHPVRLLNDADLQGLEVVSGKGLEFVVTLGTGVGTALFLDGVLAPHLEFAHHPFRNGGTYNDQLGDAALHKVGAKRWRRRTKLALDTFQALVNFDRCYVGGGNARLLKGQLTDPYVAVDNIAGILGGIKLWEQPPESPAAKRA